MKAARNFCLVAALLISAAPGLSQGFVNLNFEQAQIVINPGFGAYASNAIPGWTPYINGVAQTYIAFNTAALDSAAVSLHGTNTSITSLYPIQGQYSIFLQGSSQFAPQQSAGIGQTRQIPINALSLSFWGFIGSSSVSFNGQTLLFSVLGSTANYNIYGTDISAYAGQTGELLFTSPQGSGLFFDNIQFSSTAVPEPGTLALGILGGALLLAAGRKKFRL